MYARLLLARALGKQRRTAEAAAEARQVLQAPVDMVDEDGVPLSVEAVALLLASPADRAAIRRVLTQAAEARAWQSPIAAFTLSNLADQLQQALPVEHQLWIKEFRGRLAASIRLQEQLQALQSDAGRLGLLEPRKSVWTFYQGAEPWLVGTDSAAGGHVLVTAVRALDVFRPFEAAGNLRFFAATEPGGELLADSFPGLKVLFAGAGAADTTGSRLSNWLYYGALFVLVGATAFGTSLLWRSLRREMELAETRSQFVASVSHELKTPLTAIRMFAETLQMGRLEDKEVQQEYLETICSECERLSRLVNNVLLFAKIEQGKSVYRFRRVALADTLRRAAHTLSYPLAQHGFDLRMDLDEDLPAVNADPDTLEQAVLNLLTNAMKYSGEKREIDLRLGRRGGEAAIQVTDYGVGIATGEQTRIFEKYYRAPTPENQSVPGTGLGLTLVAQIVRAHGGCVDVESAPGKGSTFTIRLPLASEP
jgi:signal transduction histidine kinase